MVKVNWHQRYPNAQVALAELLNIKPKLESLIRQQEQAETIKISPPINSHISNNNINQVPESEQKTIKIAPPVISNISSNNITQVPESKLEPSSGQVPLNSAFYIERIPIESECFQAIMKPDALIRIKAPQPMFNNG